MADVLLESDALTVDLPDVTSTLERTVPRLVKLIRSVSNREAPAIGDWSVHDLGIHLAFVFDHYLEILNGAGAGADTFDEGALLAQAIIDNSALDSMSEIADSIEAGAQKFIARARTIEGDPIVPYVGGMPIASSCVVATVLGEVLVHGYDIARGTGLQWEIEPHASALVLRGISAITVRFLDVEAARGFSARYDIGLRGESHSHWVFDDGTLRIEEPSPARVDVHISADPPTLLLMGYGRISPLKPALTGKLLAWGRKPWLSMKMATLIRNP